MANFAPVRHNSLTKRHEEAPPGYTIEPGYIPVKSHADNLLKMEPDGLSVRAADFVSTGSGNLLSVGLDGKLLVSPQDVEEADLVSKQDGNYLRYGNDKGVYIDGNDILSNGDENLLIIHPTDKKIYIGKDSIPANVSADTGNIISTGSDGGAYLSIYDLLSAGDNDLVVGNDGKLKVVVVSADKGNSIQRGTDRGAYYPYDLGTM